MGGFVFLIIVVVAVMWYFVKANDEQFLTAPEFTPADWHIGDRTGIAVNKNKRLVALGAKGKEPTIVSAEDLIEVSVIEDSDTVTTTSRVSQAAGMAVGSLLLGPAGLLVGGLTGTKRNRATVNRLDLKILVNDIHRPVHIVNFLSATTKRNSAYYRSCVEELQHWHGLLTILITGAKNPAPPVAAQIEISPAHSSAAGRPNSSVADEIEKLVGLLDRGLITADEFERQKQKLLA